MTSKMIKKAIQNLLDKADVTINGNRSFDIKLWDERALSRIIADGSLGLGETYMEGLWDCENLDELSYKICVSELDQDLKISFFQLLHALSFKLFNRQNKKLAKEVAKKHYNLNNHLFEAMLGKSMAYSCAYWKNAEDLNAAQMAKYELICKKLYLTSRDHLLDIGCGWGGLAAYATEHYGCKVTAFSIAENQIAYAKARYNHLPIDFYTADYRDTTVYNPNQEQFTKLVSVGAFEHIGYKNYKTFFEILHEQLSNHGLFLLHTIGSNITVTSGDRWINKYIFPNSCLPSMVQLSESLEHRFLMEDWHNFGIYYDKTLMAWHQNFEAHWPNLSPQFDQQFYRMIRYYLLMCAGLFRARAAQLWQVVLTKSGVQGGYESIR